jgi:hypothetical protein
MFHFEVQGGCSLREAAVRERHSTLMQAQLPVHVALAACPSSSAACERTIEALALETEFTLSMTVNVLTEVNDLADCGMPVHALDKEQHVLDHCCSRTVVLALELGVLK